MEELLNKTIKETIIEQIDANMIKDIVSKQLAETVKDIASDIFGRYSSDFRKELKEVVIKECKVNLEQMKIPDFNRLALDTIVSEFKKYEHENKEQIIKDSLSTIRILTRDTDKIKLSEVQNSFAKYVIAEHGYDWFDELNCSCDGNSSQPEDYDELVEFFEYHQDDYRLETNLVQKVWGSQDNYCNSHLTLELLKNNKSVSNVDIHISRESNGREDNSDFYNSDKKHPNIYHVYSARIDEKRIINEGHVVLEKLNGFTKQLASMELNKIKLDVDSNIELEIENI